MNSLRSVFLALLAFLFTSQALRSAESVALIIGNGAYAADGLLPPLRNPLNDAELLGVTLREMGFRVIQVLNATRSEMDAKLTEFESQIRPGSTALVYFAGHGIEFRNKNWLLGVNAKMRAQSRLTEEAMDAETFAAAMLEKGAKASFVFLDCCRETPPSEWLTRGVRKSGLADVKVDGDIYIAYAAKPGQAALDGTGENSPYATAVAKWLPAGLSHTDFFQKVREEVATLTNRQQRTWESGSFVDPFRFGLGAIVTAPAPKSTPGNVELFEAEQRVSAAARRYVETGNATSLEDELMPYGTTVDYYDKGPIGTAAIRLDLSDDRKRWPVRQFTVTKVSRVTADLTTNKGTATVEFRYKKSNAQKSREGISAASIIFDSIRTTPKVITVREERISTVK